MRRRCSNSRRGRISPRVMARITRNAVVPFTAALVSRTAGARGPIETNSTRALAVWNKKRLQERLFKKEPFTDEDGKVLSGFGI